MARPRRALGIALSAGVLTASATFAQTGRPWVDPPETLGDIPAETAPDKAVPDKSVPIGSAAPDRSAAQPSASTPGSAAAVADSPAPASVGSARTQGKALKAGRARVEAAARRRLQRSRGAVVSTGSIRQLREPIQASERPPAETAPKVLQIMRLRTIELPDGRRIQILSKPDPQALQEIFGNR